ncbi:hypothetical protein ACM66B_004054 [Microbotryomycetes sp. NB124-2]
MTVEADPNWPADLAIRPITVNDVKLNVRHDCASRDDDVHDVEQSVSEFGIAGRTWEAAIAMRMFLTPPDEPLTSSSLLFDPPCPLFDTGTRSSGQSKKRARTIVEVGSGTGYLSLALAPWLGSSDKLVMTDLEEVCPLLERNLVQARERWKSRERRACQVLVRPLPWGSNEALATLLDGLAADAATADKSQSHHPVDFILASDLVYFPFLYPPLLRTLIGLTQPRDNQDDETSTSATMFSPVLLFSYKIRSLTRETPFWVAFGRWFEFDPVLVAQIEPDEAALDKAAGEINGGTKTSDALKLGTWQRFGVGDEDELFVFVCRRRPESLAWTVPMDDEALMGGGGAEGRSTGDDQFERILLCSIDF